MRYFQLFIFNCIITCSLNLFAQKVGIVYNINPNMGYTYFKGAFNAKPLVSNDLDYNFIDFVKGSLNKKDANIYISNEIDFTSFNNIDAEKEYLKKYCNKHDLDKILLIKKYSAYTIADPMEGFSSSKYDFGIATFSTYPKRAVLYYNINISIYDKSLNSVKKVLTGKYLKII